jgi:hypothetical protein
MSADRNVLFGILAVQVEFVSRDDLVAAMNDWVLEKTKPIGQILCKRGALTEGQHEALEAGIEVAAVGAGLRRDVSESVTVGAKEGARGG